MATSGILLVDKPERLTSHDVVARVRRALGTRKVGHAGTLDPMATGLLVVGVEDATRLLTFIVGAAKTYTATIRLGQSTDSDDADGAWARLDTDRPPGPWKPNSESFADPATHTSRGPVTVQASPEELRAVTEADIAREIALLTGTIQQQPSAVSAIKVGGRRAYDRVRSGENVELAARTVTVSQFDILAQRRQVDTIDLDVVVTVSSGTYVRALARDLGAALGLGGHLTALRRSTVGDFDVSAAYPVDDLVGAIPLTPAEAMVRVLPELSVTDQEASDLRHGKRLIGQAERLRGAKVAAIDPDGELVGIVEQRGADIKSAMNMPERTA